MPKRGGKRPGAGRPKGAKNKSTLARTKRMLAEGITPLDYLLSVVRDDNESRNVRVDAAKAAAPYVHPRLSAVETTNKSRSIREMSSEDLLNELVNRGDRARTEESRTSH